MTETTKTVETPAKTRPEMFGQTFEGPFPPTMRRQLWPLCCGASIISGFKDVGTFTEDELVTEILATINESIPDFQVYKGERMRPKTTFLTLNQTQAESAKIVTAIARAGFFEIGTARPRGGLQHWYLRDESSTWAPTGNTPETTKAA